jgi:hypothetical protein
MRDVRVNLTLSVFLLVLMGACSSSAQVKEVEHRVSFHHSYSGTRDEIWTATLMALSNYNIIVASRENGILRTDKAPSYINGDLSSSEVMRSLASAYDEHAHFSSLNFYITQNTSLNDLDSPTSTLEIYKELQTYDPISGEYEVASSDGIEETYLFKEIDRLLSGIKVCMRGGKSQSVCTDELTKQ